MGNVWFDFGLGNLDYVGIDKNQLMILFLHIRLEQGLRSLQNRRRVLSIFYIFMSKASSNTKMDSRAGGTGGAIGPIFTPNIQ